MRKSCSFRSIVTEAARASLMKFPAGAGASVDSGLGAACENRAVFAAQDEAMPFSDSSIPGQWDAETPGWGCTESTRLGLATSQAPRPPPHGVDHLLRRDVTDVAVGGREAQVAELCPEACESGIATPSRPRDMFGADQCVL